jgi:hypothetical protein
MVGIAGWLFFWITLAATCAGAGFGAFYIFDEMVAPPKKYYVLAGLLILIAVAAACLLCGSILHNLSTSVPND